MNSVFFFRSFIELLFIKKHYKIFFSKKIKKKDQNQNCTWFLICWFVFSDYVFLIKCFDYFSLLEILSSWHTTNTLHGFNITRYLAVEKEMLS